MSDLFNDFILQKRIRWQVNWEESENINGLRD